MNGETLQRIVEEIVSRLQRRAQSTATLKPLRNFVMPTVQHCSVSTRRCASCSSTCRCWVSLRMQKPTMPPPGKFTTRWRLASAYRLSLHSQLLPVIPVKKLARLPLVFTDEHGLPLVLHAGSVLSLSRCRAAARGRLVVHRKCIVTAMARDAANARNIQLIKQE